MLTIGQLAGRNRQVKIGVFEEVRQYVPVDLIARVEVDGAHNAPEHRYPLVFNRLDDFEIEQHVGVTHKVCPESPNG